MRGLPYFVSHIFGADVDTHAAGSLGFYVVQHGGVDVERHHVDDANVVLLPLNTEGFSQSADTELGGRVERHVRGADNTGSGAHADKLRVGGLLEVGECGVSTVHNAFEVDVYECVFTLRVGIEEGAVYEQPGVVEEDVELATGVRGELG